MSRGDSRSALLVVAAATTLLAALGVVWLVPRPLGDLFIGLAAGRDILAGRLGQPDDWSFLTGGRVWIDQNWGTHLLQHLAHRAAGYPGLAALKAGLLALLAGILVLAARERGAPRSVALLTAALTLLAANGYVDLRPNLMTLVLAPLVGWLLLRTRRHPNGVWLVLPALLVWANVHGGFLLGIAMLGLWTACRVVAAAVRDGPAEAIRRRGNLLAATLVAPAVAVISPFGLENLTHPFVVGGSRVFRTVEEWQPTLGPEHVTAPWAREWLDALGLLALDDVGFGQFEEYLAFLALLAIVSALRLAVRGFRRSVRSGPSDPDRVGVAVFETIVVVVAVWMGFSARRFIPLAMTLLAPALAVQLNWLLRPARHPAPTIAAAAVVLIATLAWGRLVVRQYDPDHPVYPPESFSERMFMVRSSFPVAAAEFLDDNGFEGRVYQDWLWEGYLRWRSPRLELWMGGRSQQVYDEAMYLEWQTVLEGSPTEKFAERGVHLMIVRPESANRMLGLLKWAREAGWRFVYSDERCAILADSAPPGTGAIVEKAAAGELRYPDPATAAVSRALLAASHPAWTEDPAVPGLLREAARARPVPLVYLLARRFVEAKGTAQDAEWRSFLEAEYARLGTLDANRADGLPVLRCRALVSHLLARFFESTGTRDGAASWRARERAWSAEYARVVASVPQRNLVGELLLGRGDSE